MANIRIETAPNNTFRECSKHATQPVDAKRKKPVSAGSSESRRTGQDLEKQNLKFAKDIQNRCKSIFDNGDWNHVSKSPSLLDQHELTLYIATDRNVDDSSQKMSAIMGDHDYNEKTDVTEKCFKKHCKSVTPDQDCSCLILFLHNDETSITVLESSIVLYVPSTSIEVEISRRSQSVRVFREETESPTCIRRTLTHILGEYLFTYAKVVQQRIGEYEETIKSPNSDSTTAILRKTKEAVTVLLTRRVLTDCETSAAVGSTKCEIPDDIDSALNGKKNCGVIAFGLFADKFIVFIDEKCSDQVQKQTTQDIKKNLCSDRCDFKIPLRVIHVSQDFLTDTGLEQGHAFQTGSDSGSIGMVTNATVHPGATETTTEADGPTHLEQGIPKHIVVAITAGHIFAKSNDAFFVRKDKQTVKFGKCIAKQYRKGNISAKQFDIALIEVDDNMTTIDVCSQKFRNDTGESCDGVLFTGSLKPGTGMYKKGAATDMTAGVVVSQDFRLNGPLDTQKGYLVEGRDGSEFAKRGDSGSIVFTLDINDEENRTVNLVSIVSQILSEEFARKIGIPGKLTYSVRLDKCLKSLPNVTLQMPKK
ncbi:uncharacterized protein LOC110449033 [Mizuhopecten yessoensis]|uniref:uncharacterized protein LOC110449033 n=1 Tax=Mizuhopecten yessoensis TaxID=6573 RepID=UPI000B45DF63|nr:uncharacterized protein LOC110449033 [Mizuhopecten yessoensis]